MLRGTGYSSYVGNVNSRLYNTGRLRKKWFVSGENEKKRDQSVVVNVVK